MIPFADHFVTPPPAFLWAAPAASGPLHAPLEIYSCLRFSSPCVPPALGGGGSPRVYQYCAWPPRACPLSPSTLPLPSVALQSARADAQFWWPRPHPVFHCISHQRRDTTPPDSVKQHDRLMEGGQVGAMRAGMWRVPACTPTRCNGSVAPAAAAGTQGASPAPPFRLLFLVLAKYPAAARQPRPRRVLPASSANLFPSARRRPNCPATSPAMPCKVVVAVDPSPVR